MGERHQRVHHATKSDKKEETMKRIRILVAALLVASVTAPMLAHAHGGGCRKSSPPGKCCHMEKKTGKVHCH